MLKGNLSEILDKYRGSKVFINVEVDQKELERINPITRHKEGLLNNIAVILYNNLEGETKLIIEDNKIEGELKDFLETEHLVSYRMLFDILILLTLGVKANIRDDVDVLLDYRVKYRIIGDGSVLLNLNEGTKEIVNLDAPLLEKMDKTYEKYYMDFKSEGYRKLFEVEKQFIYLSYFGLLTDIREAKVEEYTADFKEEMQQIKEYIKYEYDIDVDIVEEVYGYLKEKYGIEHKSSKTYTKIKKYYRGEVKGDECIELVLKYHKLEKLIYLLESERKTRLSLMTSGYYDIFGMSLYIQEAKNSSTLDIYDAEQDNSYYVGIETNLPWYTFMEKQNNNIILEELLEKITDKEVDYHDYIASKLYDKNIEEVSSSERSNAKKFNFHRYYKGLRELKGDCFYAFSNEYLGTLDEMYKLNNGRIADLTEDDVLGTQKLIFEKLANISQILNERKDNSIVFAYQEFNNLFVFKVGKEVSKIEALNLIAEAFDTTNDIGVNLFKNFATGDNYQELRKNIGWK